MAKFKRDDDAAPVSGDAKRDAAFTANGKDSVKWAVEAMLNAVRLPAVGPESAALSAAWLVDYLFEAPREVEHLYSTAVMDGVRWVTPYRDRVLYLTNKLVRLPTVEQQAIAAHREDGVFWRGDSMDMLRRIAETHDFMAGMTTEQRADYVRKQFGGVAHIVGGAANG